MTASPAARRRFDAMLARAVHQGTPIEEARTALEGARRVAAGHDIPRSAERIQGAETLLGFRMMADALDSFGAAAKLAADRALGVFKVVRDADGTYRREYR